MLLYACLLLNTLCLVKFQRVSLSRVARDADCRSPDLLLIKDYFQKTSIVRVEDTQDSMSPCSPPTDLDTVIDLYSSLEYVNSYKYIDPTGPVLRDGVLSINDLDILPLYQIADIRRQDLPRPNSYSGFGDEINQQMTLMGLRKTDGRGYLLPYSLGGISSILNIVPMSVDIYWHLHVETNANNLPLLTSWTSIEYWIQRFLLSLYPNGRVVWKIAVQYEENVFINPRRFRTYRPLSFSLQFTAYTNEHNDDSVFYVSPQITFVNDNNSSCKSDNPCSEERIHRTSNCDVQITPKEEPQGNIGQTLDQGNWTIRHIVAFSYNVEGKTYFFAQNENLNWSIHELLPGGKMGEETDKGHWNTSRKYTFPYFMNGTQFMYAHSNENKTWFIIELLPSGKMGQATAQGKWKEAHSNCVPYNINGAHYIFCQRTRSYFIQQLLPFGLMGSEIIAKNWNRPPTILHTFIINNVLWLFHYAPKVWITENIVPGGTISLPYSHGQWKVDYQALLTYTLKGKRFIYCHSTASPYPWFIRELLPNRTMSAEVSSGEHNGSYHIAFSFLINGRRYIYKQNNDTFLWMINELL